MNAFIIHHHRLCRWSSQSSLSAPGDTTEKPDAMPDTVTSLHMDISFSDIVEHMRECRENSGDCYCPGCPCETALESADFLRWARRHDSRIWVAVLEFYGSSFECDHPGGRESLECMLCWASWERDLAARMDGETV